MIDPLPPAAVGKLIEADQNISSSSEHVSITWYFTSIKHENDVAQNPQTQILDLISEAQQGAII